jgi:hypothetical protein
MLMSVTSFEVSLKIQHSTGTNKQYLKLALFFYPMLFMKVNVTLVSHNGHHLVLLVTTTTRNAFNDVTLISILEV